MSDLSPRRAGRRSRIGTEAAVAPPAIHAGMIGGRYKPLTDAETLRIHGLALRLLEDLGLSDHAKP